MSGARDYELTSHAAQPCAAANPAIASRLQSNALVGRVAELGSLGRLHFMNTFMLILSATTQERLASVYEQAVAVLNQVSPTLHHIRPHIVLFETDLDLDTAS